MTGRLITALGPEAVWMSWPDVVDTLDYWRDWPPDHVLARIVAARTGVLEPPSDTPRRLPTVDEVDRMARNLERAGEGT